MYNFVVALSECPRLCMLPIAMHALLKREVAVLCNGATAVLGCTARCRARCPWQAACTARGCEPLA